MKYLNINREHKYSTFLISLSVRLLLIVILLLLTLNIGFAKKKWGFKNIQGKCTITTTRCSDEEGGRPPTLVP